MRDLALPIQLTQDNRCCSQKWTPQVFIGSAKFRLFSLLTFKAIVLNIDMRMSVGAKIREFLAVVVQTFKLKEKCLKVNEIMFATAT